MEVELSHWEEMENVSSPVTDIANQAREEITELKRSYEERKGRKNEERIVTEIASRKIAV